MMDTKKIILKYNYNERNFQALDDSDKNYQKEKGYSPLVALYRSVLRLLTPVFLIPTKMLGMNFLFCLMENKGANARYLNMKLIR